MDICFQHKYFVLLLEQIDTHDKTWSQPNLNRKHVNKSWFCFQKHVNGSKWRCRGWSGWATYWENTQRTRGI